jgi:hypothetical protein
MSTATRRRILEQAGLVHPRPEVVTAPLFNRRESFFLALDKVQVKYEMLRAHVIDGLSATAAAEQHGYSRAAFYLITTAFDQAGMRPSRRTARTARPTQAHPRGARVCRIGRSNTVWRALAVAIETRLA